MRQKVSRLGWRGPAPLVTDGVATHVEHDPPGTDATENVTVAGVAVVSTTSAGDVTLCVEWGAASV